MKPAEIRTSQWLQHNLFFTLQHFLGNERFLRHFGARRAELERGISASLASYDAGDTRPVRIVDANLPREEFEKICDEPMVFRGAANDWFCTRNWSFDYFREHYGDTEIILNDNVGLVEEGKPQDFNKMTLRSYIDAVRSGAQMYLKFARDIFEDNPKLKEELDLQWLRSRRLRSSFKREEILMFMSLADTLTPMHAGVSGNFFIQVAGQKTWTLYPPGDRIYLDSRTERTFYYFSRVDPRQLDHDAFPLARFAKKSEVTLEPGDVLWVPPFYWHYVYNPTDSIGVTYRVMSLPAAFKGSTLLMTLIFFATRPNPFYHLYMSTFHKQTAIFQKKFKDL